MRIMNFYNGFIVCCVKKCNKLEIKVVRLVNKCVGFVWFVYVVLMSVIL